MSKLYSYLLHSPSTLTLSLLMPLLYAFNYWASSALTASYAASKFPVPYYVAQLSFSAEKLKAWYSALMDSGTFDVYLQTQHLDSLFILSVLLLHPLVLVLISRLFLVDSKARKFIVFCALASAIAPISDQLENLVSYIMLANPQSFAGGLAYIYSSFAAIKFGFFIFAYIVAPLGILFGLVSRLVYCYKNKAHMKSDIYPSPNSY
ncbi:hypothetical protein [Cellvibrio sp. NN19]|uniref:hypothetical protein n=1 Tax=Cellvibrio chitinivorans TaxID=3102792 RepID=UPI002B40E94C|nr:hypothetical protein [Cellvibrio sp. NN19]